MNGARFSLYDESGGLSGDFLTIQVPSVHVCDSVNKMLCFTVDSFLPIPILKITFLTESKMTAPFNVRELLELERQLYQESIERVATQHAELLRGSLEDYVLRCVPFEDEKGWEVEAAMVQLQLNKRNGLDLLEFELKQAEDVHQVRCLYAFVCVYMYWLWVA